MTVLMISPDSFGYNAETAATNAFQQKTNENNINQQAQNEFDQMVATLKDHQIRVITLSSPKNVVTPDAVFPNNWFSVNKSKSGEVNLVLYPMLTKNRRAERQTKAVVAALNAQGIQINNIVDLTDYENQDKALEGTGSLVLDHTYHFAFASLSPRTDENILADFCKQLGYSPIVFHSYDRNGMLIYHTNVMMSIGTEFVVICSASITDPNERSQVLRKLQETKKAIVEITLEQMEHMAGNILEVRSTDGKTKIILSNTAYNAFTISQRDQLQSYADLVKVNIDLIERVGGGSARCMLAEIFY